MCVCPCVGVNVCVCVCVCVYVCEREATALQLLSLACRVGSCLTTDGLNIGSAFVSCFT